MNHYWVNTIAIVVLTTINHYWIDILMPCSSEAAFELAVEVSEGPDPRHNVRGLGGPIW